MQAKRTALPNFLGRRLPAGWSAVADQVLALDAADEVHHGGIGHADAVLVENLVDRLRREPLADQFADDHGVVAENEGAPQILEGGRQEGLV